MSSDAFKACNSLWFYFFRPKEPFMYRSKCLQKNGKAFPELKTQKQLIQNVVREEEASFLNLDQGLILRTHYKYNSRRHNSGIKFELYDAMASLLTALIRQEKI